MYWGKRPRLNASAVLMLLAALYVLLVLGSSVALRGARIDLTADKLYTVSSGTLRIVASLRQPLQLTLYFSDRASRDLPQLRAYRQRVGDMLDEIARRSNGRIHVQVIDPQPYSEDEDRASAAGLVAVPGDNGAEKLFFGLSRAQPRRWPQRRHPVLLSGSRAADGIQPRQVDPRNQPGDASTRRCAQHAADCGRQRSRDGTIAATMDGPAAVAAAVRRAHAVAGRH